MSSIEKTSGARVTPSGEASAAGMSSSVLDETREMVDELIDTQIVGDSTVGDILRLSMTGTKESGEKLEKLLQEFMTSDPMWARLVSGSLTHQLSEVV